MIPIGRQIIVGRARAKDVDGEDDPRSMRDVVMNMLEETYWVEREDESDNVYA